MTQENQELKRGLKQRHLNMIAIGGTIGTALFLASGYNIEKAGAGGGPLAYALIGVLVYFLMRALGEMSTFLPTSGAYQSFCGLFVHPIFGFVVGWNVWVNGAISVGAELVGGAVILHGFFPTVNPVVWCLIMGVGILMLNLFTVNAFGEAEFWFSSLKVVTIITFLITGVLVLTGVLGGHAIGFSNWRNGNFLPHGWLPVLLTCTGVIWSYCGVETVTVAAGETHNPQATVPKAIRTVFFRILLFYVGSVALIGLIVPKGSVSVLHNGYAGVFEMVGIKSAPMLMNIVILTSLVSCTNSVVYVGSRILMALAKEGKAPQAFGRLNKRGLPTIAIYTTMAVGLISLVTNYISPDKVFIWLMAIAGFNVMLTWMAILISHLFFRRWLVAHGGKVENLKFKIGAYPLTSVLTLAVFVGIAVVVAFSKEYRFSFIIGMCMMAIYIVAGYIVHKRGKMIEPEYKKYLEANIRNMTLEELQKAEGAH